MSWLWSSFRRSAVPDISHDASHSTPDSHGPGQGLAQKRSDGEGAGLDQESVEIAECPAADLLPDCSVDDCADSVQEMDEVGECNAPDLLPDRGIDDLAESVPETGDFKEFLSHFEAIAKANGTMVGREGHNLTENQFKTRFPDREFVGVPSYGYLYCIVNPNHGAVCVRKDGVIINRKSACEWTVHYRMAPGRNVYCVEADLCNFNHSHALKRDAIRASGRRLISFEKEMGAVEINYIISFGPALLGVTKTRDLMRLKYPDRDYCGKLLARLLKKGYDDHFGSDPHAMSKFMELGNSIRQSGGVFEFELGHDGRLTNLFVMKASMKAYAKMFGDFIINDGTHNVDMYGLILMMNTLVDSLGRSIMSSYSQFRSEQSGHLVRALKHFGLDTEGATFMSDDGSAYHLVAQQLKFVHLLCVKHYHNMIFPAAAGLGNKSSIFKKDMFAAIYTNFKSIDALDAHFVMCFKNYGSVPAARKFMASLQKDQQLVCRTHTILVFSAGCKATQRGEGSNSRLKMGSKKVELRKFNLFQLLQWYLSQVELQEEQSLNVVIQLLDKGREWSDHVQDIWQMQINKAMPFGFHHQRV